MTEMEYKIINEKEHIHWFCPPCDVKVMKNLKIENNCEERCEEFLKKVEHRISQLEVDIKAKVDETRVSEIIKEANIEHKSDKVINEVMEVVKDQTMETKEREKRLNNVIIFFTSSPLIKIITTSALATTTLHTYY